MLLDEMIDPSKINRSIRNTLVAGLVALFLAGSDKALSQSTELMADAQLCVEAKKTDPDLALERCDNALKSADQFSVQQRGYLLLVRGEILYTKREYRRAIGDFRAATEA